MVEIDDLSFVALQIFKRELHPATYKAGFSGASKEGHSILGLLLRQGILLFTIAFFQHVSGMCSRCASSPGSAELRSVNIR